MPSLRAIVPSDWAEILPSSPDSEIESAFSLLIATFPKRYLHFEVSDLRDKMDHVRSNDDSAGGAEVRSLRIFCHKPQGGAIDIAVFFFLRFEIRPRAYCISLGIDQNIGDAALYNELIAICRFMQQEQGELGGVSTVDILSHKADLQADLDDVPTRTPKIGLAFARARAQLFYRGVVQLGCPWPSRLHRWEVAPL